MTALRLVFMGTPAFALPALKALAHSRHNVAAVFTQPPRPAGRGMKLLKSPVQALAEVKKIPVFTPETFKGKDALHALEKLNADLAVVAAYGLILPEAALAAPSLGCVNVHASLLPRWRGATPIAHAILAGDKETGISLMKMEKGLDTGPVIAKESIAITPADTGGSLHDRLAELGGLMIVPGIEGYAAGKLKPRPQDESLATYAPKITKAQCQIDWREDADALSRKVRALSPYPGAWTTLNGARLRILAGEVVPGKGASGEIIDGALTVACGKGAFRITRLQREGKAPLDAAEFLRGATIGKGGRLG